MHPETDELGRRRWETDLCICAAHADQAEGERHGGREEKGLPDPVLAEGLAQILRLPGGLVVLGALGGLRPPALALRVELAPPCGQQLPQSQFSANHMVSWRKLSRCDGMRYSGGDFAPFFGPSDAKDRLSERMHALSACAQHGSVSDARTAC